MSDRVILLGSKTVLLHEPYRSVNAFSAPLIGRQRELNLVMAAWLALPGKPPQAPLLVGDPGVGKTRLAHELARITGRELYIVRGKHDASADELIISARPSDDQARSIDFILTPLTTAMVTGGICLIDELGEFREDALAVLLGILDEQREVGAALLGERIEAHPRFRLIATMNHTDQLGLKLARKYQDRLKPVVEVSPASKEELRTIVAARYPGACETTRMLRHFWRLWQRGKREAPPTPRDALYVFGMAQSLAELERLRSESACGTLESTMQSSIETRHLDQVFEQGLCTLESANGHFQYV